MTWCINGLKGLSVGTSQPSIKVESKILSCFNFNFPSKTLIWCTLPRKSIIMKKRENCEVRPPQNEGARTCACERHLELKGACVAKNGRNSTSAVSAI